MPSSIDKVRENRLRRMAERRGLRLQKSPRRDPLASDYGRWWVYSERDSLRAGGSRGMTIDELESWLTKEDR